MKKLTTNQLLMAGGVIALVYILYKKKKAKNGSDMIKDALNSKTINPVQKANVAGIYADDKFQTGRIMKAAQLYAQSSQRFETVCMKLLSVDKPECL